MSGNKMFFGICISARWSNVSVSYTKSTIFIGAGMGSKWGLPSKLLGEQVIHTATLVFSVLFRIFWATSHTLVIAARTG